MKLITSIRHLYSPVLITILAVGLGGRAWAGTETFKGTAEGGESTKGLPPPALAKAGPGQGANQGKPYIASLDTFGSSRISEAAVRLGEQAERLCPGLRWRDIRGIGNWLRHQYDRVDIETIWNTLTRDLPPLKEAVHCALNSPNPTSPESDLQ